MDSVGSRIKSSMNRQAFRYNLCDKAAALARQEAA